MAETKVVNPHRIKAVEALRRATGAETAEDRLQELQRISFDGVAPACCDEGCTVEPDGKCEHGCPSVLIALGLI